MLLDKPAEAQKVPHFTARAVKGYRGPQNLPLCPTHVLLKADPFQSLVMFPGRGPLPLPAWEGDGAPGGAPKWRKGRHVVKQSCLGAGLQRRPRSVVSVQRLLAFIVNVIRMDTGLILLGTHISTEMGQE